jgi:hypothetical protein
MRYNREKAAVRETGGCFLFLIIADDPEAEIK